MIAGVGQRARCEQQIDGLRWVGPATPRDEGSVALGGTVEAFTDLCPFEHPRHRLDAHGGELVVQGFVQGQEGGNVRHDELERETLRKPRLRQERTGTVRIVGIIHPTGVRIVGDVTFGKRLHRRFSVAET